MIAVPAAAVTDKNCALKLNTRTAIRVDEGINPYRCIYNREVGDDAFHRPEKKT